MKKLTASVVSVVALFSTAALADTPTVRQMNSFNHVLEVASKSRMQSGASEFVIYHQDAPHKPCAHKKGKDAKKAAKHHAGKKHHHHDAKKADAKVKKSHAAAPAAAPASDDSSK